MPEDTEPWTLLLLDPTHRLKPFSPMTHLGSRALLHVMLPTQRQVQLQTHFF